MAKKLSDAQEHWLQSLAEGRSPTAHFRTQSEYGGAAGTRASLYRRGLIDDNGLTEAGREYAGVRGWIPMPQSLRDKFNAIGDAISNASCGDKDSKQ